MEKFSDIPFLDYIKTGIVSAFLLSVTPLLATPVGDSPLTEARQTVHIKGVVRDASGQPVIGAVVIELGSVRRTVTDVDGAYSLAVVPGAKLRVASIGFETQTVAVEGRTTVDVTLRELSRNLGELVVVGYGTQKRQNLTASISTVKDDAFKDLPVSSVDQALQGRSAGIQITTPSGNLGTAPIVRVRGVASITSGNNPLYVVDGVPVYAGNLASASDINVLSSLNPSDIASVSVLKDASAAALYGSRAANGVILITTKSGARGKAKITYDGWAGVSTAVKTIKVLNAEGFVNTKNYAVKNHWGTDNYDLSKSAPTTDGRKAFNLGYDKNGKLIDTDWNDYVFQSGFSQSHSLSIDGGTDKLTYHLSSNYLRQTGIVQGDKLERLGAAFNVNARVTLWLKVGLSHTIANTNQQTADRSRGGNIVAYAAFPRMAWADAPNIAPYDENGRPTQEQGHLGYGPNTIQAPLDNPVSILESGSFIKDETFRWLGSYYAEVSPISSLHLRTQYGRDYIRTEEREFLSPYVVSGAVQNGQASIVPGRFLQTTWTNTATYELNRNGHYLNVLLGTERTDREQKSWGVVKTNLVDPTYTVFEAPFKNITPLDSHISENALLSFFGRVNYDWKSRYIFSVNLRRDGYSALSKDHRWGNFGGASAAWRLSDEPFFVPLKQTVTDLKVKASWGVVGNTNIDNYASKTFYASTFYGSDGAYNLSQIGDADNLKWETSRKLDLGFEATLWDNVNVSVDYYNNKASDLILQVPVAPSAGIPNSFITTNAGSMRNSGVEVNIGADVIRKRDFTWQTAFNITFNKNEVLSLSDGVTSFISAGNAETTNITIVGKSIAQLYLYPTRGIDSETGRRIFVGKDGQEVLMYYEKPDKFYTRDGKPYKQSDIERVVAGNTLPTYYGGWNNTFRYKHFDATLFFQFSGGNKIYNGTKATLSDVRWWNNSQEYADNYWTPERHNAKYALPIYGDNYSNGSAMPITDWVENGDYLRLKNVIVGYTFDNNTLRLLGISALRLYAQAQNLFVITGYSGLDPEVLSQTGNATLCGGTDHNTAPQARTFTLGAQLTF